MGQRTGHLVWLALLVACGGPAAPTTTAAPIATTQPAPPTTTSPATTSPPTTAVIREGLSFKTGALDAGPYATSSFLIPFAVELPSGWYSSGENALIIGLAFGHEVMGGVGDGADPAAVFLFGRLNDLSVEDVLEELTSTSFNLAWSEPSDVELAGHRGVEVEGVNQGATYSLPALLGSAQLYQAAGEGRIARLTVLDINGKTLVVLTEAQPEEFDDTLALRDELFGLITFTG